MHHNVLIAIPSKARAEILQKAALKWLQFSKYPFIVFVERPDRDAYSQLLYPDQLGHVTSVNQGLGHAKKCIQTFAIENGYTHVVKLDDDITGWYDGTHRGANYNFASNYSHPPERSARIFDHSIDTILARMAQYEEIVAVGFPYDHEMYEVRKWIGLNIRLQTAYVARTEWLGAPNMEKFSTFEDFATYLHIRLNNKLTARYGYTGISCLPIGKAPGGLQDFDRNELAIKEIELMRQMYPALKVKKVEGKAWEYEPDLTGPMFSTNYFKNRP